MDIEAKLKLALLVTKYTRNWCSRDQDKYDFHPVIREILGKYPISDEDFALLVLEYPHVSMKDAANVAYTRDNRSGIEDRQVSTTFGRYVRRFFTTMKDHELRDYATKCRNDDFVLYETSDDIVKSIQEGPTSCMQWDYPHDTNYHPYRVYAPELGWRAVVRIDPVSNRINGRALVLHREDGSKIFVRTYKRGNDYSYADESLEFWLTENGYTHEDGWPFGTELKHIPFKGSYLLPYLDGENQKVSLRHGKVTVENFGEIEATCTDGTGYGVNNSECGDCGCFFDEDDGTWVEGDDRCVCSDCVDNYEYVLTRNGWKDYVNVDNIEETVNGLRFDREHMNDIGIVYCKVEDVYQRSTQCIELHDGTYVTKDYASEESYVCVDGEYYHPEEVPEKETE
jgi:hypothetical protein